MTHDRPRDRVRKRGFRGSGEGNWEKGRQFSMIDNNYVFINLCLDWAVTGETEWRFKSLAYSNVK